MAIPKHDEWSLVGIKSVLITFRCIRCSDTKSDWLTVSDEGMWKDIDEIRGEIVCPQCRARDKTS